MYLIFVASLNENMKLATKLQEQLASKNQKSELINLVELDIPMYDSKKEEISGMPKVVDELMEKMQKANGYVVVAPEYNYSIPPVLTNFVAWVSRNGKDFRKVFTLKYIQLATHSGGGGNDLMNAMRTQFTKLGAVVVPREIITTYQRSLNLQSSEKILEQFINLSS